MKKHLYRRLFRKAVGANPARGDQRKILPLQLYSELISEIVDSFWHEQRFLGRSYACPSILDSSSSCVPFLGSVASLPAGGGYA